MNGKPFQCGVFSSQLRRRIWSVHLGVPLESNLLDDPIHDKCFRGLWVSHAVQNTHLYFHYFSSLPGNSVYELLACHRSLLGDHTPSSTPDSSYYNGYFLDCLCPLASLPTPLPLCSCCLYVDTTPFSPWALCIKCSHMHCPRCLTDMKCHNCQRTSCPVRHAQGVSDPSFIPVLPYLREKMRGNVTCYPTEYLSDVDLEDKVLAKVVGRHVFQ